MDTTELHDLFRIEVADMEQPYGWSSLAVYSYMDDAQKMFCRLTHGILDASSSLTQLNVAAGDAWVNISPRILAVKSAADATTGRPIAIVNHEDMLAHDIRLNARVARVDALVLGMEEYRARLNAVAPDDMVIQLRVERLPLRPLDCAGARIEIAEQHHRHLLLWMKHLAYDTQDTDYRDRDKSQEYGARFRAYCADVKNERGRARHKVRTTQYGGI